MKTWSIAALAAAAVLLATRKASAAASFTVPEKARDALAGNTAELIAQAATRLQDAGTDGAWWRDFFLVTAYLESRGNPLACNESEGPCTDFSNNARGLFGLRPDSAFVGVMADRNIYPASLLYTPIYSFAGAIGYLARVTSNPAYRGNLDAITMFAARRSWAFPSLLDDVDLTHARSQAIAQYLPETAPKVGLDASVLSRQLSIPIVPVAPQDAFAWAFSALE
jgi:hypothetical protein